MEFELSEQLIRVGVIKVKGRMDAFAVSDGELLKEQQRMLTRGLTRMIIDVAEVSFLDSMALSILVSMMRRVDKVGGRMVIIQPQNEAVRQSFYLARFDKVFNMQSDMDAALAAF